MGRRVPTLPRRRQLTSTSLSLPLDQRSNMPLRPLLTCLVHVLYPCHAWNSMSASRMTTRSLSSLRRAPRGSQWRLVFLPPGTSTLLRLLVLIGLAFCPWRYCHERTG